MTFDIILGISVFLIALLGTRVTILALRQRTHAPDPALLRGDRALPVPRGGIALAFAVIVGLMLADLPYGMVLALFMLAAVSLLDDIIGVPLPIRIAVQVLAIAFPLGVIHTSLWSADLPLWLDKSLTAAVWLGFINLFASMDDMDGISATETACIAGGFFLVIAISGGFPSVLASYSLAIAAACGGFLWWNWHPARILPGEAGRVPLGFVTGYLLLLAAMHGYGFAALILPAYYLSDGVITTLSRISSRQPLEYYFQRAHRAGRKHSSVVRYVFGINLLLIFLATYSVLQPRMAGLYLALSYTAVFMLLGFFAHTKAAPHEI